MYFIFAFLASFIATGQVAPHVVRPSAPHAAPASWTCERNLYRSVVCR